MTLNEHKINQIYGKRRAIECYFKVCKGSLRLTSKCPSLDYDAITM